MDLETIKAVDRLTNAIEHLARSISDGLYGEPSLSHVLNAAQQGVHPTGLTDAQKKEVRQMIQSALDTGSA